MFDKVKQDIKDFKTHYEAKMGFVMGKDAWGCERDSSTLRLLQMLEHFMEESQELRQELLAGLDELEERINALEARE